MNRHPLPALPLSRTSLYVVATAVSLLSFFLKSGASSAAIQSDILSISGEVVSRTGAKGPVIIEVYNRPQFSPRPLFSKVIARPGPYEVRIKPGTYYLRAYIDENENQIWDSVEPIGTYSTLPGGNGVQTEQGMNERSQAVIVLPLVSKKGINIEVKVLALEEEPESKEKTTDLGKRLK